MVGRGTAPLRWWEHYGRKNPPAYRKQVAPEIGAGAKDLMARMGHSSPRAALIEEDTIDESDIAIAQWVQKR